ncbi:MAG TPA: hypothetical protein VIV82_00030 [Verrucomicrobiae bacterium]
MKFLQIAALVLCASSLLLTGCRSTSSCCADGSAMKSDCGMACCADGKTDCAHCPTCSAKK